MSWLKEIRERKLKGPGGVEVYFGDSTEPEIIPLRYPTGVQMAEFTRFVKDEIDETADMVGMNAKLGKKVMELCIVSDEDMSDDETMILFSESGGFEGMLVQRCLELMGMGGGTGKPTGKVVKGDAKKRRGSSGGR